MGNTHSRNFFNEPLAMRENLDPLAIRYTFYLKEARAWTNQIHDYTRSAVVQQLFLIRNCWAGLNRVRVAVTP